MAAAAFGEGRRGTNIRHQLGGLLRQAVYGRLAGYEDVNDAGHFADDPAMRAIVGREGMNRPAASSSQMGGSRPSGWPLRPNLVALADRRPPHKARSESPVVPRRKRARGSGPGSGITAAARGEEIQTQRTTP
jgi:hypothetical protein